MPIMPRRRLLAFGGAASAAALLPGFGVPAAGEPRPNILWLVSEDNNPFVGAYGDQLARTPHIDALAGRGILYRNVYSAAPVCAPSRFAIITGVRPESCGPAQHMRARARLPGFMHGFPEYLRQAGYYCSNNAKTDYNCDLDPATIWNESSQSAHWKNRAPGQPFFSVFNLETSHESRVFVPTPGNVGPQDVRVPPYLPDTPQIRRDFASYYNLMERVDAQIGVKLAELEQAGLADDTIVFHYSDNGGVLPRSKRFCFDEGLRCVLIVSMPPKWQHLAGPKAGSTVADPVGLIDLGPTVLSLAGLPVPGHMHGQALLGRAAQPRRYQFSMRDRMDERYDMSRTLTDGHYRYTRNYHPHRPWGQHYAFAWLAGGYQSWESEYLAGRLNEEQARFFRPKPFESLHDLQQDPDQLHDLIADPAQARRIDVMRRALDQHMLAVVDNGLIPEGSAAEGYEASRKLHPSLMRQALALAATAAKREPDSIGRLRRYLAHRSEILRWWAAQGLVMLGRAAVAAGADLKSRLALESSPQVKVSLAEALVNIGDARAGIPALIGLYESHPDQCVKLMAVNALTCVGEAARPALDALRRGASAQDTYVRNASKYLQLVLNGTYAPQIAIFDLDSLSR